MSRHTAKQASVASASALFGGASTEDESNDFFSSLGVTEALAPTPPTVHQARRPAHRGSITGGASVGLKKKEQLVSPTRSPKSPTRGSPRAASIPVRVKSPPVQPQRHLQQQQQPAASLFDVTSSSSTTGGTTDDWFKSGGHGLGVTQDEPTPDPPKPVAPVAPPPKAKAISTPKVAPAPEPTPPPIVVPPIPPPAPEPVPEPEPEPIVQREPTPPLPPPPVPLVEESLIPEPPTQSHEEPASSSHDYSPSLHAPGHQEESYEHSQPPTSAPAQPEPVEEEPSSLFSHSDSFDFSQQSYGQPEQEVDHEVALSQPDYSQSSHQQLEPEVDFFSQQAQQQVPAAAEDDFFSQQAKEDGSAAEPDFFSQQAEQEAPAEDDFFSQQAKEDGSAAEPNFSQQVEQQAPAESVFSSQQAEQQAPEVTQEPEEDDYYAREEQQSNPLPDASEVGGGGTEMYASNESNQPQDDYVEPPYYPGYIYDHASNSYLPDPNTQADQGWSVDQQSAGYSNGNGQQDWTGHENTGGYDNGAGYDQQQQGQDPYGQQQQYGAYDQQQQGRDWNAAQVEQSWDQNQQGQQYGEYGAEQGGQYGEYGAEQGGQYDQNQYQSWEQQQPIEDSTPAPAAASEPVPPPPKASTTAPPPKASYPQYDSYAPPPPSSTSPYAPPPTSTEAPLTSNNDYSSYAQDTDPYAQGEDPYASDPYTKQLEEEENASSQQYGGLGQEAATGYDESSYDPYNAHLPSHAQKDPSWDEIIDTSPSTLHDSEAASRAADVAESPTSPVHASAYAERRWVSSPPGSANQIHSPAPSSTHDEVVSALGNTSTDQFEIGSASPSPPLRPDDEREELAGKRDVPDISFEAPSPDLKAVDGGEVEDLDDPEMAGGDGGVRRRDAYGEEDYFGQTGQQSEETSMELQQPTEGEWGFDDSQVFAGNGNGEATGAMSTSTSGSNYGEWTGTSEVDQGYDYVNSGYDNGDSYGGDAAYQSQDTSYAQSTPAAPPLDSPYAPPPAKSPYGPPPATSSYAPQASPYAPSPSTKAVHGVADSPSQANTSSYAAPPPVKSPYAAPPPRSATSPYAPPLSAPQRSATGGPEYGQSSRSGASAYAAPPRVSSPYQAPPRVSSPLARTTSPYAAPPPARSHTPEQRADPQTRPSAFQSPPKRSASAMSLHSSPPKSTNARMAPPARANSNDPYAGNDPYSTYQPPSSYSSQDSYAAYPTPTQQQRDPYSSTADGNLTAPAAYGNYGHDAYGTNGTSEYAAQSSYGQPQMQRQMSNYSNQTGAAPAGSDLGLERRTAPVVSFGFGGRMVLVFPAAGRPSYGMDYGAPSLPGSGAPSTPSTVHIRKFVDTHAATESTTFPGPIFLDGGKANAGKKRKEAVAWLDQRIGELSSEVSYFSGGNQPGFGMPVQSDIDFETKRRKLETRLILIKVVKALVENEGKLSGTPKIDEAVRTIFVPNTTSTEIVDADLPLASELASAPLTPVMTGAEGPIATYVVTHGNIDRISNFLLRGERRKAVKYALDHKMWAHAFVISSCVDTDCWKDVVTEFLRSELRDNVNFGSNGLESLRVAYGMFAGLGGESVEQFLPPRPLAAPVLPTQPHLAAAAGHIPRAASPISPLPDNTPNLPTEILDKWQESVAMIVANRMAGDSPALTALGDTLKSNGWLDAAHVCYLLSPATSTIGGPTSRLSLVGGEAVIPGHASGIDLESIMLTELVEFAFSLIPSVKGQEAFVGFPHLQAYKLYHASVLADAGHVSRAQRYTDAVVSTLKLATKPSPFYHAGLVAQVKELSDRLMAAPGHDKSGSWITRKVPRPTIDSLWSTLEGGFTKFVAGDDERGSGQQVGKVEVQKNANGAIGPFSHYSSIAPGSTNTSGTLSRAQSTTDLSNIAPPSRPHSAAAPPPPPVVVAPPTTGPPPVKRAPFKTHHSRSSSLGAFTGYKYDPQAPPPWSSYSPAPATDNYAVETQATPKASTSEFAGAEDRHEEQPRGRSQDREGGWWGADSNDLSASTSTVRAPAFMAADEAFTEDDSGFISPMAAFTPSVSPAPRSAYSQNALAHKRTTTRDELDDLGIGNSRPKKPEVDSINEGGEAEDETGAPRGRPEPVKPEEKPTIKPSKSWLGGWFKREASPQIGPGPVKANLGEGSSFVYDPAQKRWVNKKAGDTAAAPLATAPPPRSQTASPTRASRSNMPPARFLSETPPPVPNAPPRAGGPLHAPPLNRSKTSADLNDLHRAGAGAPQFRPPSAGPRPPSAGPPPVGGPPISRPPSAAGSAGSGSTTPAGRRKPLAKRYVAIQ